MYSEVHSKYMSKRQIIDIIIMYKWKENAEKPRKKSCEQNLLKNEQK